MMVLDIRTDKTRWVRCRVTTVDESGIWMEGTETDDYVGVTPTNDDHVLFRLEEGDEVVVEIDSDEFPRTVALWRSS